MSRYLDEQALVRVAEQYVALWNEPDAQARRERIRELWAVDSAQVLVNAPQGMREALTNLAVPIPSVEVRGIRRAGAAGNGGLRVVRRTR